MVGVEPADLEALGPSQGRLFTTKSRGMAITSKGTIKVARISVNISFFPRQRRKANEKAAMELIQMLATTAAAVVKIELKAN